MRNLKTFLLSSALSVLTSASLIASNLDLDDNRLQRTASPSASVSQDNLVQQLALETDRIIKVQTDIAALESSITDYKKDHLYIAYFDAIKNLENEKATLTAHYTKIDALNNPTYVSKLSKIEDTLENIKEAFKDNSDLQEVLKSITEAEAELTHHKKELIKIEAHHAKLQEALNLLQDATLTATHHSTLVSEKTDKKFKVEHDRLHSMYQITKLQNSIINLEFSIENYKNKFLYVTYINELNHIKQLEFSINQITTIYSQMRRPDMVTAKTKSLKIELEIIKQKHKDNDLQKLITNIAKAETELTKYKEKLIEFESLYGNLSKYFKELQQDIHAEDDTELNMHNLDSDYNVNSLKIFPKEIINIILSYLTSKDTNNLIATSKDMYSWLLESNNVMQKFVSTIDKVKKPVSFKLNGARKTINYQENSLFFDNISARLLKNHIEEVQYIPIEFIKNLIGTNVHAITLDVSDKFNVEKINSIAEALKGTQVYKLDLSGKMPYGTEITPALTVQLIKALKETNIYSINLSGNYLEVKGTKEIAESLKGSNITIIDLSNNNMEDQGAITLASILKDTKITQINLSGNCIGIKGITVLANSLKNSKITQINLSHQWFGDEGIVDLFTGLKGTNVFDINLTGIRMTDKGIISIINNIKQTNVSVLDLSNNQIKDQGALKLANGLKGTKVHTLKLSDNNLSSQGMKNLGKALKGTNVHTIYFNIDDNKVLSELNKLYPNIKWIIKEAYPNYM